MENDEEMNLLKEKKIAQEKSFRFNQSFVAEICLLGTMIIPRHRAGFFRLLFVGHHQKNKHQPDAHPHNNTQPLV